MNVKRVAALHRDLAARHAELGSLHAELAEAYEQTEAKRPRRAQVQLPETMPSEAARDAARRALRAKGVAA